MIAPCQWSMCPRVNTTNAIWLVVSQDCKYKRPDGTCTHEDHIDNIQTSHELDEDDDPFDDHNGSWIHDPEMGDQ